MHTSHLEFPLRGLAGEGAQATVDAALAGLSGIITARAYIASQLLRITYDSGSVSAQAIRGALAAAGLAHADPNARESSNLPGE